MVWSSCLILFFLSLPCFILLPFFMSFRHSNFSFPAPQVKVSSCLDGLSIITFPSLVPTHPLLPDMGVSSSTVVSDTVMTHASILKACLINQLPYWVSEQTNFGPAENPLAISINTDACMNACKHTQWNADGGRRVLRHKNTNVHKANSRHLTALFKKEKKKTHIKK